MLCTPKVSHCFYHSHLQVTYFVSFSPFNFWLNADIFLCVYRLAWELTHYLQWLVCLFINALMFTKNQFFMHTINFSLMHKSNGLSRTPSEEQVLEASALKNQFMDSLIGSFYGLAFTYWFVVRWVLRNFQFLQNSNQCWILCNFQVFFWFFRIFDEQLR